MNILLIGGAGFIGSNTARSLVDSGHFVRVLDSYSLPTHRNVQPLYKVPHVEYVCGDACIRASLLSSLDGIDVVFHFASYQDYLTDFSRFTHVNIFSTSLLYELILRYSLPIKKIIIASSQSVYGEGKYVNYQGKLLWPEPRTLVQLQSASWECKDSFTTLQPIPIDESTVNPLNQYGISKYSQELTALRLGLNLSIPTVILRYSIVQGAGQSVFNCLSGICRTLSLCCHFNMPPIIYEDGYQTRDYVNIDDVVAANLLVMNTKEADYEVFNVGGGTPYSVNELYRIAANLYDRPIRKPIAVQFRVGDARHLFSDISKLEALGWRPTKTPEHSFTEFKEWISQLELSAHSIQEAQSLMLRQSVLKQVVS